jgi:8-oxo-dGTP pyrophosphatase MutT (NUDIX family)
MQVVEDEVVTNAGKKLTYGVVHKKPFVLLVPWDNLRLTLVRQYRYPVNQFTWEFPQGHLEHGSIIEAAKDELREETGLTANKIEEVGRFYLAVGFCSQECVIFLATSLVTGNPERKDGEEGMEIATFTPDEFAKMIAENKITDSPTVAAWALINAKNLLK